LFDERLEGSGGMTEARQQPPPTFAEAMVPITSLILLVGLSYYLFGDAGAGGPNQVALVLATMIAVFLAWRRGYSFDQLRQAATDSVGSGLGAIFILLAVGSLIGTWAMSGTLVAMVYYGLQILSPNYFYMTASIICALVSISIGSSWTTVGTIGVGLMGISQNMELNPAITAAAIISGAYFGDTSSPLSDSANLAAGTAGADLYQHLRETVVIAGLALVIAIGVFWLFGRPGSFDASAKLTAIQQSFGVTPLMFLPLVVVIGLALLKVPPFSAIFIGALTGGALAVIVAPDRVVAFAGADGLPKWLALIKGVWLALADGYRSSTGFAPIDLLATRGGMESMLNTVWLVITALAFGGVVEKAGYLDRIIGPIINAAKSTGALMTSMVVAVITTNIVTADQYMSVVLPARMFKDAFAKREFAPVVLSRSVGVSGTPSSALIPWNSCGAYMAATLGVSTISYAPYAVFNLLSPLLAIAFAFTNIRMPRSQPGLLQGAGRR
jgi:Na+:H+ antiporter, NhaC family